MILDVVDRHVDAVPNMEEVELGYKDIRIQYLYLQPSWTQMKVFRNQGPFIYQAEAANSKCHEQTNDQLGELRNQGK
jgi:hypothetical protein